MLEWSLAAVSSCVPGVAAWAGLARSPSRDCAQRTVQSLLSHPRFLTRSPAKVRTRLCAHDDVWNRRALRELFTNDLLGFISRKYLISCSY